MSFQGLIQGISLSFYIFYGLGTLNIFSMRGHQKLVMNTTPYLSLSKNKKVAHSFIDYYQEGKNNSKNIGKNCSSCTTY